MSYEKYCVKERGWKLLKDQCPKRKGLCRCSRLKKANKTWLPNAVPHPLPAFLLSKV